MKKILGILILIFAVFLIWKSFSSLTALNMANGDTVIEGIELLKAKNLYINTLFMYYIFIFCSFIMIISGILIFLNIKAGNAVYLLSLIIIVATAYFGPMDTRLIIANFLMPIIFLIALISIEKKETKKNPD